MPDYSKTSEGLAERLEKHQIMPGPDGQGCERGRFPDVTILSDRLHELKEAAEFDGPKGTAIDGPQHYNGYQVLAAICDASPAMARGFCLGNVVKYLLRAEKKGKDLQDLEKAQFYLDWYVERYEKYNGE